MKIDKTELAQKINKLKSIVPKKTQMAVLQGVLLRDGYLIANNNEMTVKAKLEGIDGETFIIPAKALDLIGSLPDGEVTITAGENNKVSIVADKIKNTYQTLNPEEFPVVDVSEESTITIKSEILLESIKRVSFAIPAQKSNQIMTALCMQAKDGELNFAGMDGRVLAWDKVKYDGEFELLIPKATIEKLLAIGLTGEVIIKHSKTAAVFIANDYEIYTRLIEGKYFNYKQVFNNLPMHTVIARKDLLDAMVRAKMCTEDNRPVHFILNEDKLQLSINDVNSDYCETVYMQEPVETNLEIGFDAKIVLETLKAFDCENLGIQLAGPRQPMIVESDDSDFRTIVSPVALH